MGGRAASEKRYKMGMNLIKVNSGNSRTIREICSKLSIKAPKRHHGRRSGVFIVTFEQIPNIVLVFLLLTLNKSVSAGKICDLLREKGPTAIKRRFKTQLNTFSIWMLCNITTSTSLTQFNAFH